MQQPSLGVCFNYGLEHLKKYPLFHIVSVFLVGMVGSFTMGILFGPMLVGYLQAVRKADEGKEPQIGSVFDGFKQNIGAGILAGFLPFVAWAVLLTIVLVITIILAMVSAKLGFILANLAYFLFLLVFLFVFPFTVLAIHQVAVKGEANGITAIKKACAIAKTFAGKWALPAVALTFIGGIGSILCGIGQFVTMPIAYAGLYKLAEQLGDAPAEPEAAAAPAESPAEPSSEPPAEPPASA